MPIMIDMEMPKRCIDCRFMREDEHCNAIKSRIYFASFDGTVWRGRPEHCPLKEVKEADDETGNK